MNVTCLLGRDHFNILSYNDFRTRNKIKHGEQYWGKEMTLLCIIKTRVVGVYLL
ncbi:hypothetical protein HanPSC8_Chr04g0184921 [Helianthus annuus]|nr:hypothetical protein HanPSC8_Chr04g0184921 [Helianthus annuus]